MTLYQIIQILKGIALTQPNIKSATDGSIYDIMNTNPSVKYDVVHFSQTTHQSDEETDYYGLNIFYVSRLEDSLEDNRLQIQSIGKEVLDNIIRTFCENWGIDFPVITYTPFTQKFNDLCAGCYCNLRLEIPKEIICADDFTAEVVPGSGIKLQDIGITITQNGLVVVTPDAEYDGIGEVRIEVDVPQSAAVLQDKEVEYTENGSYNIHPDPAYDGLSSVNVDVDVPDRYDEGYDDGKQDGEEEQKAKLAITSFTENNTYIRENGWSAVTVDVPAPEDRYDEGYADGMEAQKAKMVATAITENGAYGRPDGYSAVTVDVPSNYQDGYDDGVEDQKGKLTTLSVNENGIYTREDGWSAITVAVPQTGSSNEDLIANLQGDYYLIPYGTTHLRNYAFYQTCFSSITIPTTVSAIGEYAFAYNNCLTSITIPDSVLGVGTNAFRNCSNLQTVILGSGLKFLNQQTFFSCYSLTGITIPSGIDGFSSNVFGGCSGLTEMTFEGLVPPTLFSTSGYNASLGSTDYTFPIYVPCQSLDAYKTAFGEYYAPRIQCREQEMITAITLNVSSAITDNGTATTTYSPSNAYVDYYYTSSNPSIATIDPNTGVITVVANGSVTICTIDRISGLQDCKEISVAKSAPYATSISINVPATITDSATATTTVTPSSAQTNLRYSSSDTGKATINATTGAISVKASGTVQFCVTDTISGLQSCKNANVRKAATAITINVPSTVTDSATATTTVSPTGATTNLTYTSSNTSKATINSKTGVITVKESGSVQFCVKDSISNKQSCKTVNVVKSPVPATSITINVPTTVTDSATATTTVNPSSADTNITYTSSDTSIATVSNNGVITAKGNGTVTICAYDSISGLQSCKTITVRKSGTALNYTADTSTVDVTGETRTITYDAIGFNDNSFGISISGATGATYTKSGNVFTITFPENNTSNEKNYVVTLTATTYGGATKSATLYYTQESLPEVGGTITAIYNVTSTSQPTPIIGAARNYLQESVSHLASITIDGVTYPVLDVSETGTVSGFSYSWVQSQSYYGNLCYKFNSTGRKTVTFNIKKDSPLVTGTGDKYGEIWFRRSTTEATPLVAITFGQGIKYIMPNICGTCTSLSSVTMSNTVQKLGEQCFAQCTALTGLTIPSSVTSVEQLILLYTGGQWGRNINITMQGTTPATIASYAFAESTGTFTVNHTIRVPNSALNTYKTTGNWVYYANNIVGY